MDIHFEVGLVINALRIEQLSSTNEIKGAALQRGRETKQFVQARLKPTSLEVADLLVGNACNVAKLSARKTSLEPEATQCTVDAWTEEHGTLLDAQMRAWLCSATLDPCGC
jgi:hypothetical protein